LSSNSNDADSRQRAARLLAQLVSLEEQLARSEQKNRGVPEPGMTEFTNSHNASGQPVIVREVDPEAILRESLRKPGASETQAQGTLARIDCDARGITFLVRINERLLKLKTDSFRQVDLMSFSADAGGEVTCGTRKPENNVIVAYVLSTGSHSKVDGVIRSVEFVPPDFKLKVAP
jgi:hypothetical protein